MRALVLLVVLGCSKDGPPPLDCKALLGDPGTALIKLTEQETDPSKVYATLEECLAPGGDTCDRAAAGGAMMPSMAISDGSAGGAADRAAQWKQYAIDCRTLPPDSQRCLLLSYAITHTECGKVQEDFRRR